MCVVQFQNRWGAWNLNVISKLRSLQKKLIRTVILIIVFQNWKSCCNLVNLQDSENPILTCQNWDNTCEVFRGHTCNVIDFVARQEVVLVLAVTVVVVDVTCTHKKVSTWDMPGEGHTSQTLIAILFIRFVNCNSFLHGIDALGEVGFKSQEWLALLSKSTNRWTAAHKYLLLWSSHSSSQVQSRYFPPWKCFKQILQGRKSNSC